MIKKLVLKITNFFHFLCGLLSAYFIFHNLSLHSILITVGFIIYQILDYLKGEELKRTLDDIQEFIIGFVTGVVACGLQIDNLIIKSILL